MLNFPDILFKPSIINYSIEMSEKEADRPQTETILKKE